MNEARSRCRLPMMAAVVFVLCLAFAFESEAGGFRNPPAGGEALGRVGGNIAQADGAATISLNPANLANLTQPQAQGAMTILYSESDYTAPTGQKATTEEPWKFLPDAYGAMPFNGGKLVAGVGITTPFGQSTEWSQDSVFRYTAPYYAELRVVNVNPSVATRLGDNVLIGGGVDIFGSDLEFKQMYPWSAVIGAAVPDGEAKFTGDGTGVGGNIGLTWNVTKRQVMAVTYRSPVKVDYDGDFKLSNVPGPMPVSPSADFSTDITFPAVAGFGYGLNATDKLRVEADVEWIQFSSYDSLPLDVGQSRALLTSDSIDQDWKDSWTFGLGADLEMAKGLLLRAGYIYIQSPIPDDTLAPTLPDADRHVISAGVGYKQGSHAVDLAYAYSIFDDRTIDSDDNAAYNGTYEITSHLMAVSYSYSF